MTWPNPNEKFPIEAYQGLGFLKNFIQDPNIIIGDYTYYDDPEGIENFEKNVLYRSPMIDSKLIIGKFCAIATGVKFIMNAANHKIDGFSSYPFGIFGGDWMKSLQSSQNWDWTKTLQLVQWVNKWDTIVWNDVWIGYNATILSGVKIWNGAIIWANATVTKDVDPYAIVWWNPAQLIRYRFDQETIEALEEIGRRDWNIEKITKNLHFILGNDIQNLKNLD